MNKFENPEIQITTYDVEDVITTSDPTVPELGPNDTPIL